MPPYNVVNVTQPVILRTGGAVGTKHHQTDSGLLWTPPGMQVRFASGSAFTNERCGATIKAFQVQNNAAAANCGVGFRLANRTWIAGIYDGTTYTDFTADCQTATGTVTLGVDGADQSGFVIGCLIPFDWVSVNITTAEVDAGAAVPDHNIKYSLGTSFSGAYGNTGLTNGFYQANAVWGAAATEFVWAKPTDWAASTGTTGLPNGYYYLYFTTADREAGDTAAIATGIEIGVGRFRSQIAQYGLYTDDFAEFYNQYADGMIAYFSIANAINMVSALVRQGG